MFTFITINASEGLQVRIKPETVYPIGTFVMNLDDGDGDISIASLTPDDLKTIRDAIDVALGIKVVQAV